MTPKTTTQNLLLWGAALALAVLLSFLGALAQQLPGDAPINWRIVALNVVQTILSTAPIIAAGFGLPRLGKEPIASLVSAVGPGPAKAALEDEVVRQATGQATGPAADDLADQIVARIRAQMETPAPAPLAPLSNEDFDRLDKRRLELMNEAARLNPIEIQKFPGDAPTPPRQPDPRLSNPMAGSG